MKPNLAGALSNFNPSLPQNILQLIQLQKRLHRRQRINIHLTENLHHPIKFGVNRFKDAHLIILDGHLLEGLVDVGAGDAFLFQLGENFIGALDDGFGHTRHCRYVDTEAVLRTAGREFA